MSTPTITSATVHLRRPSDLVTAVPYLLGFHPDPGSIVILGIHDRTVAFTVRLDAPAPDVEFDPAQVWIRLARPLADADTHAVVVIGYLPADRDRTLLLVGATAPVPLLEILRVDDGRWWSLTCPDDCCPPGQPLDTDTAQRRRRADRHQRLPRRLPRRPDHPPAARTPRHWWTTSPPACRSTRRRRGGYGYHAVRTAHAARTDGPVPLTADAGRGAAAGPDRRRRPRRRLRLGRRRGLVAVDRPDPHRPTRMDRPGRHRPGHHHLPTRQRRPGPPGRRTRPDRRPDLPPGPARHRPGRRPHPPRPTPRRPDPRRPRRRPTPPRPRRPPRRRHQRRAVATMSDTSRSPRLATVRVTPGGSPIIHTAAWIAHRTRGVHEALTEDLHRWARHRRPRSWPDDVRTAPDLARPGPAPGAKTATTPSPRPG